MSDMMGRLETALAGRYRIERELGQGGMATVYLAEDLRHGRNVAIKVLRPELAAVIGAERFVREIRTIAALQHPHILGLIDSGEVEGTAYYVMPYVEGESLRDRLTREKQLAVPDAIRIATEVASALDYAHRHGVIHRDIKPENVLLHDGSALVADFGIALAVNSAGGGTRMTETGMSLGTPTYMAPEQALGEREITARADLYALGAMTYEMLVGDPPFTGSTAQAIVAKVVTEVPRGLVDQRHTIPPHVEAAVLTALEKLPADRYASAAEFAAALASPGAATTRVTASRPASRKPVRWQQLLPWVLLAVATGLGVWGWWHRPQPRDATWLTVDLADTLGITTSGVPLAVSADGELMAFREAGQNGLLWLKRKDQLAPVPIPGTERAFGPAFSPDGQWLAYTADGQLKKIRPNGGAAMTLADSAAGNFYGITWLDDGTIVYTSPSGDQLRRVSGSGGAASIPLADSTLRGTGLLNLSPLPDARGVLFAVCSSGCVTSSLHVADFRSGTQRLLLPDAIQAWYLPIGYLFYVRRDGAAFIAPFDPDRQEITGPAVPALDRIQVLIAIPMLAWSQSGLLVYAPATLQANDFELVRVSRSGLVTPVDSGWSGAFNSFMLSPDGRRAAIGAGATAGGLSIWIKQLDHGPFTRLTFGTQDRRPSWSPDGRLIAFVRDSLYGGRVYVQPVDGSGSARPMTDLGKPIQEVTWSPDGKWLAARTDNATAGAGDLIGIRTSGDTTPIPLVATPFSELHPAISPDTRWIAYTSNESGTNEVYVRSFPSTSGGRWQVSIAGGSEPVWSPDGRELFYIDGAGQLIAASVASGPVFAVDHRTTLFSVTGLQIDLFHQSYSVLPDGRGFMFLRQRSLRPRASTGRVVLVQNWFADLRARTKR